MTLEQTGRNAKIAGIVLLSIFIALAGLKFVNLTGIIIYTMVIFFSKAILFFVIVGVAIVFFKKKFNI